MSNKPEIKELFDKLLAERTEIEKKSGPVRAAREKLIEQMRPLEAELLKLNTEIQAIEMPRLAEVESQLAHLAKALGGLSLSQGQKENGVT